MLGYPLIDIYNPGARDIDNIPGLQVNRLGFQARKGILEIERLPHKLAVHVPHNNYVSDLGFFKIESTRVHHRFQHCHFARKVNWARFVNLASYINAAIKE